jgi:hypothetical protein
MRKNGRAVSTPTGLDRIAKERVLADRSSAVFRGGSTVANNMIGFAIAELALCLAAEPPEYRIGRGYAHIPH